MYDDFTRLIVVLAIISVVSWVVVGVTLVMRYAARLRYFRQHPRLEQQPAAVAVEAIDATTSAADPEATVTEAEPPEAAQ